MRKDAIFNTDAQIEPVPLHDGNACYVVDDVLVEPGRLRAWAVAQRDAFRPVDFNAYPGQYLEVPDSFNDALRSFYLRHMRAYFDARRLLKMHCRLSMVTIPPATLRPYQWLCHSDNIRLDPGQSIQASVLYLFEDAALGGTSFYKPRRTFPEIARLFDDSARMSADQFTGRYGISPGYMIGDNDFFVRTGTIPARWNRMIFYDGSLLHSGDIEAPQRLTSDPATGRLTFNGFFTARSNAR